MEKEIEHTFGPWKAVEYGSEYQLEDGSYTYGVAYGKDAADKIVHAVSNIDQLLEALEVCRVTLETFLPGAFATRSLVQSALEKAKGTV
jgi:hypothetical protein